MKLAFISYEFPPETGYGGIGTYTYQIAMALAERGHHVEVFSSSPTKEVLNNCINGLFLLHRVQATKRSEFSKAIVDVFGTRNSIVGFDLIESPEYCGEGLDVRKNFPQVPMVVKLHAPLFLITQLERKFRKTSLKRTIKKYLGRDYNKNSDRDYQLAVSANVVCSPSKALAELVKRKWKIGNINIIPNVFVPSDAYLSIPFPAGSKIVCFMGKLNVLKGMKTLTEAIPGVLKKHPDAKFRFIGKDGDAPDGKESMIQYMKRRLHAYEKNLEFTGYVHNSDIPAYLNDVDIIVLPSLWENYPYTCLEGMSAGKAIVGSVNGGMKEILDGTGNGLLINPSKHKEIVKAIIRLLDHPVECANIGKRNREKVKENCKASIDAAEQYYQKVISKHTCLA